MSFLSEILKQRQRLQETETMVTTADGRTHVERKGGRIVTCTDRISHGFVVDTKPDRTPAMVIEHLYIGSQDCTDIDVLTEYNIKHVLSVGIEVNVDVSYKFVPCLDLPESDIIPVLEQCVLFIRDALRSKENVLVHCNAGVSRAAMVLIGYLICEKEYTYKKAYRLVKEKRPAIQPNDGFVKQLKQIKNVVD